MSATAPHSGPAETWEEGGGRGNGGGVQWQEVIIEIEVGREVDFFFLIESNHHVGG